MAPPAPREMTIAQAKELNAMEKAAKKKGRFPSAGDASQPLEMSNFVKKPCSDGTRGKPVALK